MIQLGTKKQTQYELIHNCILTAKKRIAMQQFTDSESRDNKEGLQGYTWISQRTEIRRDLLDGPGAGGDKNGRDLVWERVEFNREADSKPTTDRK